MKRLVRLVRHLLDWLRSVLGFPPRTHWRVTVMFRDDDHHFQTIHFGTYDDAVEEVHRFVAERVMKTRKALVCQYAINPATAEDFS